MRRVSSQINVDEMVGMDESAMELELIKLQANYRHLSDFYDSYKEESQRKIKTQNDFICELLEERAMLEMILGNASKQDKRNTDRNRAQLTALLEDIKNSQSEVMAELELLRKDDLKLSEVEDQLMAKRIEMGGIYGPLQQRLRLMKRRDHLEKTENSMVLEFNNTLAINHDLRLQINHIRSERNLFNEQYRRVVHQLTQCKKQKADVLQSATQALEHRQEALTKIQVHKDRDEKEQVVFNQSMKVLERLMAHEKKMNEFMTIKCNDRAQFKMQEANKIERDVRETLDSDLQTLNQYKESFDSIREVAELDDVDAIVAQFLQQEAENFALFNYVTELNGEIESRQEEVNAIQQKIDRMREEQQHTIVANKRELEILTAEHTQLQKDVTKTTTRLNEVTTVLKELQKLIANTFDRVGCSQKALEDMLGLNVPINTNNMIVYLGQIEQRANELLNILHYVNIKTSETTGLLPQRIDMPTFETKALPEMNLQFPVMLDREPEPDESVTEPMTKADLREAASASIQYRDREYMERMLRATTVLPPTQHK